MNYCLTPEHVVLTTDGFKKISDLFPFSEGSVSVTVTEEELNLHKVVLVNAKFGIAPLFLKQNSSTNIEA